MDDCHLSNIARVNFLEIKNKLYLIIWVEIKNLKSIKKWTYILCNKNNIVKDLMKEFLNSHYVESHLQRLYVNLNKNRFEDLKLYS
jgi:hypothetical protein